MIQDVLEFHKKFGLPEGNEDKLSKYTTAIDYREDFLDEELTEFKDAMFNGDRVGAFDALLDLVYVAHGTALFMGISPDQWDAGMKAIQVANMAKERVASSGHSKRGSAFDVVKPEGWVGPEAKLEEILNTKSDQTELY